MNPSAGESSTNREGPCPCRLASPLKKREPRVEMVLQAPLPDSPTSVTDVLVCIGDFSRNDGKADKGASVEEAKFYQISFASECTTDGIVAFTVLTSDLNDNDVDDDTEYSRYECLKGLPFVSDDLCGGSDISED